MKYINAANKFNFDLAYTVYNTVYHAWGTLSAKEKKKARRQVESMISEAGFRGVSTKLISEAAWETVLAERAGFKAIGGARKAKEHPITYTNIAMFCLTQKQVLQYEDYFKVWFDNLITTTTTSEENYRLQKSQKNFVFGVDCWKEMYHKAGIKLIPRPDLRAKGAKLQHGLD